GVLVTREGAFGACYSHDSGVTIDLESAEAKRVRRAAGLAPAHDRAQTRQQLSRFERLGQVVVGADLQADDAVHRLAPRGEHQHRYVGLRPQLSTDLEPVPGLLEDLQNLLPSFGVGAKALHPTRHDLRAPGSVTLLSTGCL